MGVVRLVGAVGCVGLLAGCSGGVAEPGTVAGPVPAAGSAVVPAGEAPAFHFRSGDLPLGPFDPYQVLGNVFDPCAEISAEEFAAAGFTVDPDGHLASPERGVNTCTLRDSDPYVAESFAGNAANQDAISAQKVLFPEFAASIVPGIYVYEDGAVEKTMCSAAVETLRGSLVATVRSLRPGDDFEKLCDRAVGMLEALYVSPK